MKLIWNDLLHANFRCGRMCGDRAEHLAVNCTMPLAVHECVPECDVDRIALNCVCPVRLCITHRVFCIRKLYYKYK